MANELAERPTLSAQEVKAEKKVAKPTVEEVAVAMLEEKARCCLHA